mmetsp:Transcript_17571/g.30762  ORF Transcript_17571/g.30762 Transcript_17571/m.30762 type:complete len:121 (-) Transcript_17571:4-366(-)
MQPQGTTRQLGEQHKAIAKALRGALLAEGLRHHRFLEVCMTHHGCAHLAFLRPETIAPCDAEVQLSQELSEVVSGQQAASWPTTELCVSYLRNVFLRRLLAQSSPIERLVIERVSQEPNQ